MISWMLSFFGASASSAVFAWFVVSEHRGIIESVMERLLGGKLFFILFYCFYFLLSVVVFYGGRRGAWIFKVYPILIESIRKFYAPVAGNLFGWALAIFYGAFLDSPEKYAKAVLALGAAVFFMMVAPVATLEIAKQEIDKYTNPVFSKKQHMTLLRWIGASLFLGVLAAFIHDVFF